MIFFFKKQNFSAAFASLALCLLLVSFICTDSAESAATLKSQISRLINEGINYHNNRNYLLSIQAFKRALSLDPSNTDITKNLAIAHNNYGKYLAERTDGKGAAREFRNALYYDPNNEVARKNLEYKLKENNIDANDHIKRLLQAKQERLDENFIAAIAELREANRIQENVDAYLEIGANYHLLAIKTSNNDPYIDAAINAFTRARDLDTNDPRPLIRLGDINVATGKVNRGIDFYEQAVKIDPENEEAQSALINGWLAALRIAPHLANNHVGLATAYQLKGDYVQAERSFRRALQIDPNNQLAKGGLVNLKQDQINTQVSLFLDRAIAFQQKGDYDKSLSNYIKALNLEPSNPDIHYNIGTAFQAKGDLTRAHKAYTKAAQLDTNHVEAKTALGVLNGILREEQIAEAFAHAIDLQEDGKHEEAIKIYNRIAADRPDDDSLFYNLAVSYQSIGEFDNAVQNYHKAHSIKAEPRYLEAIDALKLSQANELLAKAIDQQSKALNDEAIDNYLKVVELVPGNSNAWYNLGTAYQAIGKDYKALEAYQKSYGLDPNNQTEAMFFAALILEDQRKLLEAVNLYNKYLTVAPKGDYASEAKERKDYIKSFL